ncbi:MAG: alpha/beta hydrolase [Candidatus Saccharimonas sp.]|nr:alpha/beta hydrolase [Planctomycetaceae bacterium]
MAVRRADRSDNGSGGAVTAAHLQSHLDQAASEMGRIVRFRSQDGLSLAARIFAAPKSQRLPLFCLSGLSRNSRDFLALGRFFAHHPTEPRSVFAFDYRGRGLSESDSNWRNYKPLVEAQDLLSATALFGIHRAIVVGSSRGGIIAMMLGSLRPTLLAGVVLNDIGPVVEGTGLARIKKYLTARPTVRNLAEAIGVARRMNEGQFPGLSEGDWRAFVEAYFIDTGSGLTPQFDPNLAKSIPSPGRGVNRSRPSVAVCPTRTDSRRELYRAATPLRNEQIDRADPAGGDEHRRNRTRQARSRSSNRMNANRIAAAQ